MGFILQPLLGSKSHKLTRAPALRNPMAVFRRVLVLNAAATRYRIDPPLPSFKAFPPFFPFPSSP